MNHGNFESLVDISSESEENSHSIPEAWSSQMWNTNSVWPLTPDLV